jgi:hypothetical protein
MMGLGGSQRLDRNNDTVVSRPREQGCDDRNFSSTGQREPRGARNNDYISQLQNLDSGKVAGGGGRERRRSGEHLVGYNDLYSEEYASSSNQKKVVDKSSEKNIEKPQAKVIEKIPEPVKGSAGGRPNSNIEEEPQKPINRLLALVRSKQTNSAKENPETANTERKKSSEKISELQQTPNEKSVSSQRQKKGETSDQIPKTPEKAKVNLREMRSGSHVTKPPPPQPNLQPFTVTCPKNKKQTPGRTHPQHRDQPHSKKPKTDDNLLGKRQNPPRISQQYIPNFTKLPSKRPQTPPNPKKKIKPLHPSPDPSTQQDQTLSYIDPNPTHPSPSPSKSPTKNHKPLPSSSSYGQCLQRSKNEDSLERDNLEILNEFEISSEEQNMVKSTQNGQINGFFGISNKLAVKELGVGSRMGVTSGNRGSCGGVEGVGGVDSKKSSKQVRFAEDVGGVKILGQDLKGDSVLCRRTSSVPGLEGNFFGIGGDFF